MLSKSAGKSTEAAGTKSVRKTESLYRKTKAFKVLQQMWPAKTDTLLSLLIMKAFTDHEVRVETWPAKAEHC